MGNCSSSDRSRKTVLDDQNDMGDLHGMKTESELDENYNRVGPPPREKLDELLDEMQKHHMKRLEKELSTDIHLFTLNNMLMCIQFWNNFEM